jgi:glycosyltransferase involved in cell wall biosynthesis
LGHAGPTILQIIPNLDTGGAELSTIEIAEAIVAAGGRALVATNGGRLAHLVAAAGGHLRSLDAATKNPFKMIRNAGSLGEMIRAENVSLLHARSRAPAWSAFIAARRAGIPWVTTYHGAYAEKGRAKRLYNSVMARADRVIANSGYTGRLVAGRYGTGDERIRVIHRGVDLEKFDPSNISPERVQALISAWRIDPGRRVIIQAARLTSWKGQRVLIDAAGILKRSGDLDGAVVVFAGDEQGRSGYRDDLAARATSAGVSGDVRFAGHVADIAAAFRLAHVAVIASVEPEAFGRTATEAQALGCPVIATRIGAPPETVLGADERGVSEATGWLVPANDAVALADRLREAMSLQGEERDALGRRARAHVAASFTLDAMKLATLNVYDELLGTDLARKFSASRAASRV